MNPRFFPSCDRPWVKMADRFASRRYSFQKTSRRSNGKTMIGLGCRKLLWFVGVSQINYLPQPSASAKIDLLTTDKSRSFVQPRPIIVNYHFISRCCHLRRRWTRFGCLLQIFIRQRLRLVTQSNVALWRVFICTLTFSWPNPILSLRRKTPVTFSYYANPANEFKSSTV